MQRTITQEDELEKIALEIIEFAGHRRVVTLTGDLGAGKTTLVKAIAKQLHVDDSVTSPTFSLINEYHFKEKGRQPLYHIDLYRLNNVEEALQIGIEEYLYSSAWCFIEWPDVIEGLLPEDTIKISIDIQDDGSRRIQFFE